MAAQLNDIDKYLHKRMIKIDRLPAFSREFGPKRWLTTSTPMGTTFNAKVYSLKYYRVEGIYFMKGVSGLQKEAQKFALKEAVNSLGGIGNFADELGLSKYTIKNIIYDPTKDGNLKCVILAVIKGGADINVVSPGTPKLNAILKEALSPSVKSLFLKDIIVNPNIHYLNYCHDDNEFILVDENFELISGFKKLRELESKKVLRTAVKVLNLDDLWNGRINIYSCGVPINDIRIWEIVVKLVNKYGKGQGFRSDFEKNISENCSKIEQLSEDSRQVKNSKKRPDTLTTACNLFDISTWTFYQLNKVCCSEIIPLIKAISQKQVSISRAAAAVSVFFLDDPIEREKSLHSLLAGEIDGELLEEIKEMARLQGSKAPRLQGSKAPRLQTMLNEYKEYANEYQH